MQYVYILYLFHMEDTVKSNKVRGHKLELYVGWNDFDAKKTKQFLTSLIPY